MCSHYMHKLTLSQVMVPKQFLTFTSVFLYIYIYICDILYVVYVSIKVYYLKLWLRLHGNLVPLIEMTLIFNYCQ